MKKIFFVLMSMFVLVAALPYRAAAAEQTVKDSMSMLSVSGERMEDSVAKMWDIANTAYVKANYNDAIHVYNNILARGVSSPKLYYNLANAYFKVGKLGSAVLYYNRAIKLDHSDADARYNLDVVKGFTKDKIEEVPPFFLAVWLHSVRHITSSTGWGVLSLVSLGLLLGSVLLYLFASRLGVRKSGFFVGVAMAVVFLLSTWFAVAESIEMTGRDRAVVMAQSVAVKSSPMVSSTDLFILHEGTELRRLSTLDGWSEVTIADGRKGWVESSSIEII